jgi:serine/threonine protein kinase
MDRRIRDFELGPQLGAGSFGEVYAAFDRSRNARVALKRLRQTTAQDLYRFKKEFRALADIFHPNVVTLHELFAEQNDWFIVMDLVEGPDIVRYVRTGELGLAVTQLAPSKDDDTIAMVATRGDDELDVDRARAAFVQLARGVHALHLANRLHRDLKPSNVLVGKGDCVKILDFGLVTELTDTTGSLAQMVGTPAYMAPEQASGERVSAAADWYAVGAM